METSPVYNVLIRTYGGLNLPNTLSMPTPASTSIKRLYINVAQKMQHNRVQKMIERQTEGQIPAIGIGPKFNLALPTRDRLELSSDAPISSLVPEDKRQKPSPNLNLEMKAPMVDSDPPISFVRQSDASDFVPQSTAPSDFNKAGCVTPEDRITLLISGFPGLESPTETSGYQKIISVKASNTIASMYETIRSQYNLESKWLYGGGEQCPVLVTTSDRRRPNPTSQDSIATLLSKGSSSSHGGILTIRLSARTLGGKGGFGSQLRAAGGRMSSRKSRNQTADQQNASNRNLDGRRIRTITEAKNLATYLAMKPDMDKKEREEKRKRWEAVVEAAERKENEIKRGRGGNVRLDGQWVEQKEEAEGKTRDAVLAATKAGLIGNDSAMLERTGSESSVDQADSDEATSGEGSGSSASSPAHDKASTSKPAPAGSSSRTFFGWDEDDEDMSDEDDEEDDEVAPVAYEGKGKAKA